jgi:hypothetical protein
MIKTMNDNNKSSDTYFASYEDLDVSDLLHI